MIVHLHFKIYTFINRKEQVEALKVNNETLRR